MNALNDVVDRIEIDLNAQAVTQVAEMPRALSIDEMDCVGGGTVITANF